jgi:hypothetical protein
LSYVGGHSRLNERGRLSGHRIWWGSMVTPVDTPDFGAIVLPVPIPLLYLGSLSGILGDQAFYRRKGRTFASVDGRIDREGEQDSWIDRRRQDKRSL